MTGLGTTEAKFSYITLIKSIRYGSLILLSGGNNSRHSILCLLGHVSIAVS
jgi:hypothetical protein